MDPAAPALSPDLRIGSLLSRAWRTYRSRPWFLLGTGLAIYVLLPAAVVWIIPHPSPAPGDAPSFPLSMLLFLIAGTILAAMLNAGYLHAAMRILLGETPRADMLLKGFRKFWPLLGWTVLAYLGYPLLMSVAILPGILAGAFLAPAVGVALGALMLLPVAYLAARLLPSLVVLLETGLGPLAAFRTSWRMTRGHGWRTALALVAALVLVYAPVIPVVLADMLQAVPDYVALPAQAVIMCLTAPLALLLLLTAYDELARAYASRAEAAAAGPGPDAPAGA